jgi:site-specific DNA recombinase
MQKPSKPLLRCAIYTRKSTEHNLDLEFNSLDAQREACAAYIKSQAHEGWRLIPARYDDGAFSGASLDRPALQTLLADIQSRKVDIVVVYKVDRLTRSLADFAKLVELFDQHAVSFVSVTQFFNTTTSMGRLTLNVLLSFAQFEREVIGERVRDKIAASKKKGLWVGGPVPLGYASRDKKLVIVPEEADAVRAIFARYLELGSVGALVEDLDCRGIRTKRQVLTDGRIRGGCRFGVGSLAHLLKNRFYIGEVVYRDEVHPGEQTPIVERVVFEAVQAKLAQNTVARARRLKGSPAILTGRIFDDRGNRMTPTHANKRGVRYRYYVSHALLQKRHREAGSVARVAAPEIETLVVNAIRERFDCLHPQQMNVSSEPATSRDLIARHVEKVVVRPQAIEIALRQMPPAYGTQRHKPEPDSQGPDECQGYDHESEGPAVIVLPWTAPSGPSAKGILHTPSASAGRAMMRETRDVLIAAIAKARAWVEDLASARISSFAEIAAREGKVERHVRFLAPLAFVSPRLLSAVMDGTAPAHLTVTLLAKAMPYSWAEQDRQLGLHD